MGTVDKTLNRHTLRMFVPNIFLVAFILTSASAFDPCYDSHKGPCKKTSQCLPLVTPMNSTHLRVNWEKVFEGCKDSHIKKMKIEVEENTSSRKEQTATLSQKETFVQADPCLQHNIRVRLILTQSYSDEYGRRFLQSSSLTYNKIELKNEKYPFGGLLNITVVPKICLKENGTIIIPSPPEALKNCEIESGGVKSGDLKDSDFDKVGAKGTVKFTFKSPQNSNTRPYKNYIVKDIQACPNVRNGDGDSDSLVIVVVILVMVLIVICLISMTLFLCWKRHKKAKSREINREVDANPVYGIYALNDEGEDIGVTEFKDTNDYYVM